MPPPAIIDPQSFPQDVVVDLDGLRALNPQRFEMEQLTAITLIDPERKLIVGYKDVTDQEFWIRGHMPGYPLMPGVLMCEAAAQLCSYYCQHVGLLKAGFIGFGGMNEVRFRGAVRPGDRLWLVGRTERHSSRQMLFEIQGFVGKSMVLSGEFIGVPMVQPALEPATPAQPAH